MVWLSPDELVFWGPGICLLPMSTEIQQPMQEQQVLVEVKAGEEAFSQKVLMQIGESGFVDKQASFSASNA